MNQDPLLNLNHQIELGLVPGWRVIRQSGEHENLDIGVERDVWPLDALYVAPSQAVIHSVSSLDINDVGSLVLSGNSTGSSSSELIDESEDFIAAGILVDDLIMIDDPDPLTLSLGYAYVKEIVNATTLRYYSPTFLNVFAEQKYRIARATDTGAAVIFISEGLDDLGIRQQEFLILNGTNVVSTDKAYSEAQKAEVVLSGASQTNEGDISATQDGEIGTPTSFIIVAGTSVTKQAIFTVPQNEIGFFDDFFIGHRRPGAPGGSQMEFSSKRSWWDVANSPIVEQVRLANAIDGANPFTFTYDVAPVLPPGTRLVLFAEEATDANTTAIAGFQIRLKRLI